MPPKVHDFCGLVNLDHTCYMNSCLQAFYTSNSVRNLLMANAQAGPFNKMLSSLFQQMSQLEKVESPDGTSRFPSIRPAKVNAQFRRVRPEFVLGQSQDAQEFLNFMLDLIHQETNQAKQRKAPQEMPPLTTGEEAWKYHQTYIDDSPYSSLLVGQTESVITCSACGNQSRKWDSFWQLNLNVNLPTTNQSETNSAVPEDSYGMPISVNDCVNELQAPEILANDCAPTCSACNARQGSTKKLTVCKGPDQLIVMLRRLTPTGQKIKRKVKLDSQLVLANRHYSLVNCVLHKGSGDKGHYMALFKEASDVWFLFDDHNVQSVKPELAMPMLHKYGYVCIYQATD